MGPFLGFLNQCFREFYCVAGLGCAMVDTSSTAAVASLYGEDSQLGAAMGLVEACLGVGWVVGPAFGGFLAEVGGFGLPFYLAGVTTLVLGPIPVLISGKRALLIMHALVTCVRCNVKPLMIESS